MGLARKYNTLLKRQLLHYAAWSPVTDDYEVGDFGGFRAGVFQKLGNIREFGVDPNPQAGTSDTDFSFTSSGTVMVRSQAGAEVDVFPDEPVEAKLAIEFTGKDSFYIRSKDLTVMQMPSVGAVAQLLRGRRDANGRKWRLGWRVVRKVYVADDPAILASSEKGASFSLTGTADALKQLEVGRASADINVTSTKADVLQILGGKGPVAIDLFRVRITGLVSFAPGADEDQDADENADEAEPELDDDWLEEPDDDPEELFA